MSKSVFCIGASTRLAYQKFLPDFLPKDWTIDGPQENCGDSTNVLKNLDSWLNKKKSSHVTINCGMHDIRFSIKEKIHQVPISDFEKNLRKIFLNLKNRNGLKIFWHSMIPIDDDRYNSKPLTLGTKRVFHRFQKDFNLYDQSALEIAKEFDIPVISFKEDDFKERIACYLSEDGIHYGDEAYKIMATKIAQHLIK